MAKEYEYIAKITIDSGYTEYTILSYIFTIYNNFEFFILKFKNIIPNNLTLN